VTDIDTAIDRLLRAASAADLPAPLNPASDAEIEALRVALLPLRIPSDLERLWRRLQDGVPGMIDRSDLLRVTGAVEFRDTHEWPNALLTIAYMSHWFHLVELDGPDGTGGGTVWEVGFTDLEIREVAPSLSLLLDAAAAACEMGIATPYDAGAFRTVDWDDEAWERLKADRWPDRRTASARVTGWPRRWLELEGLDLGDAIPRGATTTVGALRALGQAWRDPATLGGTITSLFGSMDGAAVVFDDGSGELVVFVPRMADPFQLLAHRALLELDVRPFEGVEPGPAFNPTAIEAVATAVRRSPDPG
jgi:hypothetical protein